MRQRLYRSQRDKKIFGVCGGLGQYFDIDPTWIRIGVVLTTICFGFPILIYILLAMMIPREPQWTDAFALERYGYNPYGYSDLDAEIDQLEKRALQQEVQRLRLELAKYK